MSIWLCRNGVVFDKKKVNLVCRCFSHVPASCGTGGSYRRCGTKTCWNLAQRSLIDLPGSLCPGLVGLSVIGFLVSTEDMVMCDMSHFFVRPVMVLSVVYLTF